ncbi:hypothetical protein EON80_27765 [bacterium]|nr:MAG: hypothetical protein EON80_27765 [bacterium]
MKIFPSLACIAAIGSISTAALVACPKETIPAPIIEKVTRSERTGGVWHDITVSYQGKARQKLKLQVFWDAKTPTDDGKGTSTKSQDVSTNAQGKGRWKMEVKGYPAGKMFATVTDAAGNRSAKSPIFDVPWLY